MSKTHTELKGWTASEFPFETDEETIAKIHKFLPEGYWLAEDLSSDADYLCLMRWDEEAE